MLDHLFLVLTFAAAIGCGLIAGVFLAFSSFVMKALARLSSNEGIAAMQSISVVVLRSVFIVVFIVTAIDCVVVAIPALVRGHGLSAILVLAGSALYIAGAFIVTGVFNVPRNELLATVNGNDPHSEAVWKEYVSSWTVWNHVRTVSALAAGGCFILALTA